MSDRESMEYDVVIVGAGPAGLATGIRLKQINPDISVCILEKGSEVGAHIISGAIMDPIAINELFPNWRELNAPLKVEVKEDEFLFLTETKSHKVPNFLLPSCFRNEGNYIVRLGDVVRWMGQQAETLGVEIFPGFAATEVVFHDDGSVKGVATGDMGLNSDGTPSSSYQPGMELHAKYTIFAEGSRGQLGRELISKFQLDQSSDPQTYNIGFKELWEVKPENSKTGLVIHTAGWPMPSDTYGGSFLYHLDNNLIAVGFAIGLNYSNPWMSPFEEFQRFKTHPDIRKILEGGKRLSYGARAITAGGLLSLPKFVFPGGALVGCEAGFLNASRIKGSHAAIKTGMMVAEAIATQIGNAESKVLEDYERNFKDSWLYKELNQARNFKQWFKKGLVTATIMTGIEQKFLKNMIPWTLHNKKTDHESLRPASEMQKINYPKPDGVISFDRLSSVFLSNTNHEENQPCHLKLKDDSVPVEINLKKYAGPEQRYCPAAVYEFLEVDGSQKLRINAQNCIHCKTCDIKDPTQNIVWTAPQGGEGPVYNGM
ncbi:electron transfer flavoprotein-ubiquinone oxidoreductase [Taylorella equigenitalis]|uniref:Electron transfer flavoprotein-ubiquinone oxidoreductase n=1 Tax=Taylorella equigenitalis ATCC 35865 TaxID=743973 RepID=A0ABM5N9T2_9BURK|nr:electron transfer flavoprotein-ubiquinone oxidoreductase [Taylorella equigenitalis]AFN35604.1 putative electron transfer flavoprotein-ubiquinone oxidoreductase [Taylorella equigenitalis ATCC 35865]ASY39029.1 electron transfer flavoprotein-ubiquinone oxidoreductase [Taylorella equigenitalis]WDU52315.1 electron transfer flavoprotein-ubiquinone oxidoreductase [Taylorella equigenitalis]VEG30641.1 Electron transfer flavoprotein-ubiquinone oxidoreductase [Taylorella equigenitalis ATCC 35865]